MRNKDLDKRLNGDEQIGNLQQDNLGQFRIVAGKRIEQIKEVDQRSKDLNLIINRERLQSLTN